VKIIGLGAAALIGVWALTAPMPARSACSLGWCSEDENSPSYKQWLQTNKEELDRRERSERASKQRAIQEDIRRANAPQESMLYQMLAQRPDQYVGEIVGFNGRVAQSIQAEGAYVLRVEVAGGPNKTWKDAVYVEYRGPMHRAIADGDIIHFRGKFIGIKGYEAVLGNTVHIPAVRACELKRRRDGISGFGSMRVCGGPSATRSRARGGDTDNRVDADGETRESSASAEA
jgi:hypothetical protein